MLRVRIGSSGGVTHCRMVDSTRAPGCLHMHRIERAGLEEQRVADGEIAQVEQKIEPLGRGEKGLVADLRRWQEASIIADQRERHGLARRGPPAETVSTRVGGVER